MVDLRTQKVKEAHSALKGITSDDISMIMKLRKPPLIAVTAFAGTMIVVEKDATIPTYDWRRLFAAKLVSSLTISSSVCVKFLWKASLKATTEY